jgi:hypothetical protein
MTTAPPVRWTIELVGPHGYIHGWIKVGMDVEHKDGSKGKVTKYDPNTQTATIDFKSGPRAGNPKKTTTKAYHLKQGADPGPGHVEKPASKPDLKKQQDERIRSATKDRVAADKAETLRRFTAYGGKVSGSKDEGLVTKHVADTGTSKTPTLAPTKTSSFDPATAADHITQSPDTAPAYYNDEQLQKVARELLRRAETGHVSDEHTRAMGAVVAERQRRMGLTGVNKPATLTPVNRAAPGSISGGTREQQAKFKGMMATLFKGDANPPSLRIGELRNARAYAEYDPRKHEIAIRPDVIDETDRTMHQNQGNHFADHGQASILKHTLTHEYGHSLEHRLNTDEQNRLLGSVLKSMGVPSIDSGVTSVGGRMELGGKAKAAVTNHVGVYATTNPRELAAELYSSALNSTTPSPAAKIVLAALTKAKARKA